MDADIEMMKSAGINVVRIGESTWGTLDPHDGEFDYSHIDRVIQAMDKGGISVIVGTPTYAPAWLARACHGLPVVAGPDCPGDQATRSVHPGINFTGRLSTDPLGTMESETHVYRPGRRLHILVHGRVSDQNRGHSG